MGHFAEDCATKYSFTREEQDNFSKTSLKRAMMQITMVLSIGRLFQ